MQNLKSQTSLKRATADYSLTALAGILGLIFVSLSSTAAMAKSKPPKPAQAAPDASYLDIKQIEAAWKTAVHPEHADQFVGRWLPIAGPRDSSTDDQYFFDYYPTGMTNPKGQPAILDIEVNQTKASFISSQIDSDLLVHSNLDGEIETKMVSFESECIEDNYGRCATHSANSELVMTLNLSFYDVDEMGKPKGNKFKPFWIYTLDLSEKYVKRSAKLQCNFINQNHQEMICQIARAINDLGWTIPHNPGYLIFKRAN